MADSLPDQSTVAVLGPVCEGCGERTAEPTWFEMDPFCPLCVRGLVETDERQACICDPADEVYPRPDCPGCEPVATPRFEASANVAAPANPPQTREET